MAARTKAVELWLKVCGDVLSGDVPRTTETAQETITGEVLLDNQLLVELLRRLGRWDDARAAAAMARKALDDSLAAWDGEPYPDLALIIDSCDLLLFLEQQMIADHDDSPADARVSLPDWFVE